MKPEPDIFSEFAGNAKELCDKKTPKRKDLYIGTISVGNSFGEIERKSQQNATEALR